MSGSTRGSSLLGPAWAAFPKSLRALGVAVVLLIGVNLWVGEHLRLIVNSTAMDECFVLERRIAAFPDKQAVKVVVFGNSHSLAGLRPPLLAKALGLPANAVFSFALPGAPPQEMRLLAERFLPAFSNTRLALCGIDEPYLVTNNEYRMRYWTRDNLAERIEYASGAPGLDDRVGLTFSWFFPLADYLTPIQGFLGSNPRWVAHVLLRHPEATGYRKALLEKDYPWGLTPPWDCPSLCDPRKLAQRDQTSLAYRECAAGFMANEARTGQGLQALGELSRIATARGCRLVLLGMPYPQPLLDAIETHHGPAYQDYQTRLSRYLRVAGEHAIPSPPPWQKANYYDTDHLNPKGAQRLADWVRQHFTREEWKAAGASTVLAETAPHVESTAPRVIN